MPYFLVELPSNGKTAIMLHVQSSYTEMYAVVEAIWTCSILQKKLCTKDKSKATMYAYCTHCSIPKGTTWAKAIYISLKIKLTHAVLAIIG